jgi:hypothetical protein
MPGTHRPFVLLALVLSSACSDVSPVAPVAAPSLLASALRATNAAIPVVTRPAGGQCVTQIQVLPADFPILLLHITGVCTLQHLGRVTLDATQTVNLISLAIANDGTYTAANGDVLHAPFTGVATFNSDGSASFTGSEVYEGGTGRFSNASGSSSLSGTATIPNGEYTTSGSIAY